MDNTLLKAYIDQYITTNGQGDITGAILNGVLNKMVDELGRGTEFGGQVTTLTSASDVSHALFYLATEVGTYTNLDNIVVSRGEIAFIQYESRYGWRKYSWSIASLLAEKQDTIDDLSTIRSGASAGATAYQKPSGGIPSTDMSSAVQTSLGKADTALQSFTETDPTVPSWAKAESKPTYTASEVGAIASTEKGANSGVATLDSSGKVPSSQLPSYVDDVQEYTSLAQFPAIGESGKIYVAINTNKTYRWGGSTYVEIAQGLALGETSSTAFAGDRGKAIEDKIPSNASSSNKLATMADLPDGTTDYGDLTNKPQINSVTLSGNKSASDLGLATAAQGAKADTAYQKPQSGIPSTDLASGVQTSLGKADTAVQSVTVGTTTTGAAGSNASVTNSGTSTAPVLDFTIPRGANGADAVNPFKGWFSGIGQLETMYPSPNEGDYAYVKGATASDPVAIYECTTNGSWSDSGRTFNPANNQEFASGEDLNTVHIVDNLDSDVATDVLSARQGGEIRKIILDETVKVVETYTGYSEIIGESGDGKYLDTSGNVLTYATYFISKVFHVKKGDVIDLNKWKCQAATCIAQVNGSTYTPLVTIDIVGNLMYIVENDIDIVVSGSKKADSVVSVVRYEVSEVVAYGTNGTANHWKSYEVNLGANDKVVLELSNISSIQDGYIRVFALLTNSSDATTDYIEYRALVDSDKVYVFLVADSNYTYLRVKTNSIADIKIYNANAKNAIQELGQKIDDVELRLQNEIDNSVSEINATIDVIEHGVVSNYTEGQYLGYGYGNLLYIDDEGYGISDYIPYEQGNSVTWKWGDSKEQSILIAFFNNNKEWISGAYWGGNQNSGEREISSTDINTYASNAKYIRASFVIDAEDAFVMIGDTVAWTPRPSQAGLDTLSEEVEELRDIVEDIEYDTGGTIASFNKFKRSAIDSIAIKIGTQQNKSKNNYFCILHQSDIHGDGVRFSRMVDFANTLDNVNAVIETGDFQQNEWGNTGFDDTYVAYYQNCNVPILPVIGNHDVGNHHKIYTNPSNTNEAVGAKYITPYMTAIGGVQGGTNAGYYYRDFADFKIRVIVLNEYETPRIQNSGGTELKYSIWSRYISQPQANWLVGTLNSVQSDWSVIICMHQLIDVFPKYDNEFKCSVNYGNSDVTNEQGTIIQDIVDAYISKGTLSKSYHYQDADTSEVPDVTVNADFTAANGEFICYINGHTHNDGNGQSVVATNKQVNLNVTTGNSSMVKQAIYDDLYRGSEGISQDAFNMIAFDTDKKQIRIMRIGANVSADMRRRDYACISYAQS